MSNEAVTAQIADTLLRIEKILTDEFVIPPVLTLIGLGDRCPRCNSTDFRKDIDGKAYCASCGWSTEREGEFARCFSCGSERLMYVYLPSRIGYLHCKGCGTNRNLRDPHAA
jgi:transcription elongation factor Elf1